MKRAPFSLSTIAALLTLVAGSSCTQLQTTEPVAPPAAPEVVVPAPKPDPYKEFLSKNKRYPYTMTIFRNKDLLKKANRSCPIYICLSQQRGRLYVDGRVAADWPVSTGTPGHSTPTGTYRIMEKKRHHRSNTWGRAYDSAGKCVNGNANSRRGVPEGGRFVGASMPYWQRLTATGIGMHVGKVRAGRRLSHGCIRTPGAMARELFGITGVGTQVTVTSKKESCYPDFSAPAKPAEQLQPGQAPTTTVTPVAAPITIPAATPAEAPAAPAAPAPAPEASVAQTQPSAASQQQPEAVTQQQPAAIAQQQQPEATTQQQTGSVSQQQPGVASQQQPNPFVQEQPEASVHREPQS